jgi:hypothetical protein
MIKLDEKPKVRNLPRFVPVIFGNGEDDDAPGLQAMLDNEAVQLADHIYEPGEAVDLIGLHLVIYRPIQSPSPVWRKIAFVRCFFDDRA